MRLPPGRYHGTFGSLSVTRKGGLGTGRREFVFQFRLDADAVIDLELTVDADEFGRMLCEDGYTAECVVSGDVSVRRIRAGGEGLMDRERAPSYPPTPELDKMLAARERLGTQHIGEFFEWLQGQGIFPACQHEHNDSCFVTVDGEPELDCAYHEGQLVPLQEPFQRLLERYADVDPVKVEQERQAVLAWAANRGEATVTGKE